MAVSLRLSTEEEELFKSYAKLNNMSMSELFRVAVIERIEDEYDLEAYQEAKKEYESNPVRFTLDEVEKELGLSDV